MIAIPLSNTRSAATATRSHAQVCIVYMHRIYYYSRYWIALSHTPKKSHEDDDDEEEEDAEQSN